MEINVRNKKTCNEGEYIGRPSPLGNMYVVRPREVAIKKYADWLQDAIHSNEDVINELDRLFSILIKEQKLTLLCWCSPKPCHGDIIKKSLLNKYYTGVYYEVI